MKCVLNKLMKIFLLVTACVLMNVQAPGILASEPKIASPPNSQPNIVRKSISQKVRVNSLATGKTQPWQLIRRLQHAQDAIVLGKPGALRNYRKLLVKYSGLMLAQDEEVWSSPKNLNAAAIYVLAGGNPIVGIKAVETSKLDDEAKRPLFAAVAYAERNFAVSHKLLIALDHTKVPPSAAAQFALAKSMVTSSTNLKLAKTLLNEARRLAPGTLIEEAALRRSFRFVDANTNLEEYRRNASSYLRNFRRSLYFSDFLKNFAFGLMRMPREKEQEVLKYLKIIFEELNKDEQLRILVYTARSATVTGRVKTAYWSSKRALELLDHNNKLHTRMSLYFAASGVVQPKESESSIVEFGKIKRSTLDKNDQKLFDAVTVLVKRLQGDPMDFAKANSFRNRQPQAYPGDVAVKPRVIENEATILESNTVLMRAKKLLADLDEIMPEQSE